MNIEKVNISELKPLEVNVRNHGVTQIKELKRSVEQFGQTRAIVIDEENTILIGNGLFFALREMGRTTADCYRVEGLSDKEKKKLILSDNKIFSLGSDDYDNIEKVLSEITMDGDFDVAGFDDEALKKMFAEVEAISEQVEKYGIITEQPTTKQTVSAPEVADEEESVPETKPSAPETPKAETPKATETRKSVICPNCGEVIYFD